MFTRSRAQSDSMDYQPNIRQRVVLGQGKGVERLSIVSEVIRPLHSHEVLVRVHATPIHISDLSVIAGNLSTKSTVLGLEGCGRVIAKGSGMSNWTLIGKRVAFLSRVEGSWCDHVIVNGNDCVVLEESTHVEVGALNYLNPMTALSFLHIASTHKSKALLNTVAGTLGKMLIEIAIKEGYEIITIVKSQQMADEFRQLGKGIAFAEDDEDMPDKVRAMCLRLDCTVAFDCKGGQITPLLLDVLPPNSHLYLYGNLDGEVAAGINPNFLIEQNKHIHGFSLPNYLATLNNITLMSMKSKILALGSTTLSSTVQARFNLDQCAQAILFYANSIDSGKCLLMPDPQYQLDPSNNSLLIANIGEDGLNILEGFGNRDANGSVGSVGGGEGRLSEGRLSEGGLNEIIQVNVFFYI
eukprot:c15716_g1_i3.p1 GENE.c15716_g1_i3~~c15716_g1_i3.p1  ORF type:complete len:418 (+),score=172.30 c15716_g1_i3:24-1256(+)